MKKAIIVVVAILAVGGGIYFGFGKRETLSYSSVKVSRGEISRVVNATGVVQAQNRLEIKPPLAGRIERILVEEGQYIKKGAILAWMSSTERVALVDTATAKGKAERKRWEEMYRPTPVLAPLTGRLILKNVEPGQTVAATDVVFVMSDHLIVRSDVDETDIGRLSVGEKATITLDAYPDSTTRGKVDHIAFDAKTANNVTVYSVDILPDTVPDFMRSGMTANVVFLLERKSGILMLPEEAIHKKDGARYVRVPTADPESPKEVEVKVGISDGKNTELLSGLAEGETVLVRRTAPIAHEKKGTNPFMPGRIGGGRGGGRR